MRESMPLIFGWKIDFAKHPTQHVVYFWKLRSKSIFIAAVLCIQGGALPGGISALLHTINSSLYTCSYADINMFIWF